MVGGRKSKLAMCTLFGAKNFVISSANISKATCCRRLLLQHNVALGYSPRGNAVHDQLAWFAANGNLVLDFALVRAQVAALNGEQGAALERPSRRVDLCADGKGGGRVIIKVSSAPSRV